MAFTVKAIKPQKLNVDAIRLEILNELRKEGRVQVRELKKTTKSWKHKVQFGYAIGLTRGDASVLSGVTGGSAQLWEWMDKGTRPHTIRPKKARMLRFRTGYKAKTKPRRFSSGGGGASGPTVFAKQVRHPGTKPRKWTETLSKRRRRPFTRNIIKATNRGAKKLYKGKK